MNLRSFDLNLLVALNALLEERHVSRAAERVGLSQPAMSAALQRCRDLFNDQLLERGRGEMRLTPRAAELCEPLKSLLADAVILINPQKPSLMEVRQLVRIVMADFPAIFVMNPLQRRLQLSAPGIDIAVKPWHGADAAAKSLIEGSADIAISVFDAPIANIRRASLFEESYVVAMREGHPAADDFNLEQWLRYPHVLVSGRGDTRSSLDDALTRIGRSRRIGVVVPTFQMVAPLLAESDLIAMLPLRVVAEAKKLISFQPPVPAPGFTLRMAWHERRDKDPVLRHVVAQIGVLLR